MNKTRILLYALCLGILVGVTVFSNVPLTPTGQVIQDCYVDNLPCSCGPDYCVCGEEKVPATYCTQDLNSERP